MNNKLHPFYPAHFKDFLGFDDIMRAIKEGQSLNTSNYPPYNVFAEMQPGNIPSYTVEIAVAGFSQDQLEIQVEGDELKISGDKVTGGHKPSPTNEPEDKENPDRVYFHRNLAQRYFHLKFKLGQHVEVKNASLENGILTVYLEAEVPEKLKPKKIEIKQKIK